MSQVSGHWKAVRRFYICGISTDTFLPLSQNKNKNFKWFIIISSPAALASSIQLWFETCYTLLSGRLQSFHQNHTETLVKKLKKIITGYYIKASIKSQKDWNV